MYTVTNPEEFSFGSAAIHIRSSPTTCVDAGFGEMNVLPSSLDLPVVMFTRLSRLENARLSAVGVGKLGSVAVSLGPIAQSQSPPPALWSGAPMNLAVEPIWLTRIALHCSPVGPERLSSAPSGIAAASEYPPMDSRRLAPVGPPTSATLTEIVSVHGLVEQLIETVSALPVKVGPVPGSGYVST